MQKIVINRAGGGFELSVEALVWLNERGSTFVARAFVGEKLGH